MKHLTVLACLALGLAATSASAQAIRNPTFENRLTYWWGSWGLTNNSTPGTVTWEDTGSVLMAISGSPGSIALTQPMCAGLNPGDSAWIDFTVVNQQYSTIGLHLGDMNGDSANGQEVKLTEPSPGSYHLAIYADKAYPQGTWYCAWLLCWPGRCTVRVSRADARPSSTSEREIGSATAIRRTMEVNPNPAAGRTKVSFSTPRSIEGRLAVYDAAGSLVRDIEERRYSVGDHSAVWDGRDYNGRPVAPGTYFVRLIAANGRVEAAEAVMVR